MVRITATAVSLERKGATHARTAVPVPTRASRPPRPRRRRRPGGDGDGGPGAQAGPGSGSAPAAPIDSDSDLNPFLGGDPEHDDVDDRAGRVVPSAAQRASADALDATVRWNRFGTPQSLIRYDGYLATGLSGDPAVAARGWLRDNAGLFRLTPRQVGALELVSVQQMPDSAGRAVLFRQRLGGLPAAVDGMVTVGVTGGKLAYVSSSIAGESDALGAADLTAVQAWLAAAADLDRGVLARDVSNVHNERGWTVFAVDGFTQAQQVRQRALPSPDGDTRRVWEVNVVDVSDGETLGFTSFVDAASGDVVVRQNRVAHHAAGAGGVPRTASPAVLPTSEYTQPFTGTCTATECGTNAFEVDDMTQTIVYSASRTSSPTTS